MGSGPCGPQSVKMDSVTSSSLPSEPSVILQQQPPPPPPATITQQQTVKTDVSVKKESVTTVNIMKQEGPKESKPSAFVHPFQDINSKEYIERYNKMEADYAHRLMAKYFSEKDFYGESVFDGSKVINGETMKMSRVHCASSYADPVQYLKDKNARSAQTQTSFSNDKHSVKKEEK